MRAGTGGILLLWTALSVAQPLHTLVLGEAPRTWESGGNGIDPEFLVGRKQVDTSNVMEGLIELKHRPGWISPRFFTGEENVASLVLEGQGSVNAPNSLSIRADLLRAQLEGLVNGDHSVAFERKPTPFNPQVPAYGIWVVLDLGRQVGVHRVRFYPRNTVEPTPRQPFHNDYLRAYEVWINPEQTSRVRGAPDILVDRELENEEPVVAVEVPPQYVRLVKLRSLTEVPFEIDELEVYGTGYLGEATYLSDLIDLGDRAAVGRVRWVEEVAGEAPFSQVVVRVRTGLDNTPILFRKFVPCPEGAVPCINTTPEISEKEYWDLPEDYYRLPLIDDEEHWSPWKLVQNSGLVSAPGPRRFIQFQFAFKGRIKDARLIDRLSFDYLSPPIADTLRAEVFPRLARAEQPASFQYAVLLRSSGDALGYDELEVDSNAPVVDIRNLRVDGRPVGFEVVFNRKDGFRLRFPLIERDGAVLEFTYDLPIFRFGTTFSARAYNRRFPSVPQQVEPGQAVRFGPADTDALSGLSVEIPKRQIGKLVGEILLDSRIFTPNGDGVNDELRFFFNLLQLVEPAPVALEIFDLSGRRVQVVFEENLGIGPARQVWDGRLEDGSLVPPGNYVWVLRVKADAFEERHSGVVAVAY